jgi:hypothetical protein
LAFFSSSSIPNQESICPGTCLICYCGLISACCIDLQAEPMPPDSSTAITPPINPSHDYSKESRGIAGNPFDQRYLPSFIPLQLPATANAP